MDHALRGAAAGRYRARRRGAKPAPPDGARRARRRDAGRHRRPGRPRAAGSRAGRFGSRAMTPDVLAVFALGVTLVIAIAAFVAAPLWGGVERLADVEVAGERERWEREKRQALLAIKETELDYQMGKLSDEDLQRMRTRFERQALDAMAALEREQARQTR